jgi:hypothetical protein
MGARFTGLIKTRRQMDYAQEVWAFLFEMAREKGVKNVYY